MSGVGVGGVPYPAGGASVTYPITVGQGGTNATDAATARSNLGLAIGADVIGTATGAVGAANIATGAYKMYYFTGGAGIGAISAPGLKVGDVIESIYYPANLAIDSTWWETTVTVANQIQQLKAGNMSASYINLLVLKRGS